MLVLGLDLGPPEIMDQQKIPGGSVVVHRPKVENHSLIALVGWLVHSPPIASLGHR